MWFQHHMLPGGVLPFLPHRQAFHLLLVPAGAQVRYLPIHLIQRATELRFDTRPSVIGEVTG